MEVIRQVLCTCLCVCVCVCVRARTHAILLCMARKDGERMGHIQSAPCFQSTSIRLWPFQGQKRR